MSVLSNAIELCTTGTVPVKPASNISYFHADFTCSVGFDEELPHESAPAHVVSQDRKLGRTSGKAVSYTHLTLPTNREV